MAKTPFTLRFAILFSASVFLGLAACRQMPATRTGTPNDDSNAQRRPVRDVSAEQLIPSMESKATSKKERLRALHTVFRGRESLSRQAQVGFLRSTRSLAVDKQEDARLRADALWALAGLGMMLRHEKTWTQEDVSRECRFLLQTAADESENLQVRRMSIAALGDLKMKEAVPVLKALLAHKANLNRPEVARPAAIALAELAPEDAIEPIGKVLCETDQPSVFGSAAYALGRTNSRGAIPLLVENRLRLGDNLSVDNAIGAMSDTIMAILKTPADPLLIPVIQATRSLWRHEQKAQYSPLLRGILADRSLSPDVRREALKRLMEDADALALDVRNEHVSALLPLFEGERIFPDEVARMRLILRAQILPVTHIEGQHETEAER